jgi:hypothetical protein
MEMLLFKNDVLCSTGDFFLFLLQYPNRAAYYLRPPKRYISQVVNSTGNSRPVLGTQLDHIILLTCYNSQDRVASINIMCYNNHVCINCVYGIYATFGKLILSVIIEFQCDQINYVPWQCSVVAKRFPSRIYKTESFEKI